MPSDSEPRPMATPPWGTPNSPTPTRSLPSPAPAGEGQPTGSEGPFFLLIEQTVGSGESRRWSVEPLPGGNLPSRPVARQAAEYAARTFSPRHPMSERRRSVYRVTPDEFVIVVEGMTMTAHFRVTVVERLA